MTTQVASVLISDYPIQHAEFDGKSFHAAAANARRNVADTIANRASAIDAENSAYKRDMEAMEHMFAEIPPDRRHILRLEVIADLPQNLADFYAERDVFKTRSLRMMIVERSRTVKL